MHGLILNVVHESKGSSIRKIGIYLSILHIEINDVKVFVGKCQVTDCIVTLQPLCMQRRIHIHIPQM